MLHGVRISYHQHKSQPKDDGASTRRADRGSDDPQRGDEKALNSRQRRSRARAKVFYEDTKAAAAKKTTGSPASAQLPPGLTRPANDAASSSTQAMVN